MYSAIVLCAGAGKRTGLEYNKMLYSFKGKTVYEMTLEHFINDDRCKQIVVVTKEVEREDFINLIHDERIVFVNGGKERQDSVFEGLKVVNQPYVLIHDGARPYVKDEHISLLLECLKTHKGCLLMVPCKDTVKEVHDGRVVKTLERAKLMQAQTPQAFEYELIYNSYKKGIESHYQATDDAQMVETFSDEDVYVVVGDYENKKITTPEDL